MRDKATENQIVQSSPYAEAFESGKNAAAELYEAFQELFWRKSHDPVPILDNLGKILSEAPTHHVFIHMVLTCAWFSALGTDRGRRIASIGAVGLVTPVTLSQILTKDGLKIFWGETKSHIAILLQTAV